MVVIILTPKLKSTLRYITINLGTKKIANKNRIIPFGIIKESLLIHGVSEIVINVATNTIRFNRPLSLDLEFVD